MKNAENFLKRTSIVLDLRDFEHLIGKLTNDTVEVDLDEGVIELTDSETGDEMYKNVLKLLSEYFDVNVTSVHCDGFDLPYVWVVYKD